MYTQLGDIIFSGLHSFSTIEHKDTSTWAQHDLLNAKPTLQPTGNDLEEFTIEIKLRAEFINPEAARLQLKKYKDENTILPYIKGTGQYMGDFIITELTTTTQNSLPDGTVIEATLNVSLREYVVADKLQQQQAAARKQAFAAGSKTPVAVGAIQQPSLPQTTAAEIAEVNSFAFVVDRSVSQYANNVTQQQNLSDKIQNALNKMEAKLQSINNALDDIELLEDIATITSAVNAVQSIIGNFTFPITSIADLQFNNSNLQSAIRNFGAGTISILNLVITRAA
jgi:phage protein U